MSFLILSINHKGRLIATGKCKSKENINMNINKEYLDPNGIWMVTTEGDCEGRSQRSLGVYKGRIDEIAFALSSSACYTLTFKKIVPNLIPASASRKTEDKVVVNLDDFSWGELSNAERRTVFAELTRDTDILVGDAQFYKSVTLTRVTPEEKARQDIISKALAKLSDDEKEALGLSY